MESTDYLHYLPPASAERWRSSVEMNSFEYPVALLVKARKLVEASTEGCYIDFMFATFENIINIVAAEAILCITVAHDGGIGQLVFAPFTQQYT